MARRREVDEVVVDRICAGASTGGPVTSPDAAEVVRRLVSAGYGDGQIAFRLGFTRRSVVRIRQRLGIAAALPVGSCAASRLVDAPTRPRALG